MSNIESVVLDSSVWVNGLLGTDEECKVLIKKVINRKIQVMVNTYIVAETINAIRRTKPKYESYKIETYKSF